MLYGHPLRSAVPAHHRAFADVWQRAAEECDEKAALIKSQRAVRYDRSARLIRPLRIGQQVLLQDPKTGLWDRTGVIVGIGKRRDYFVRLPSGRAYWRDRRYLRPLRPLVTVSPGSSRGARPDSSGAAGGTRCDDRAEDRSKTSTGGTRCDDRTEDRSRTKTDAVAGDARGDRTGERSAAPLVPVRRSARRRQQPKKLSVNWSDPVYEYV